MHHDGPYYCYYYFPYRAVIVENIPEDVSFSDNGTSHVPLSVGLHTLLDRAKRAVEIVSPQWLLNSSDYESSFQPAARQVKNKQTNKQTVSQRRAASTEDVSCL